jgi:CHAT domain-containing protein
VSFLQIHLQLASHTPYDQIGRLIPNIQGRLKELYDLLLAPIASHLATYRRLIIVPHGPLHYAPFHAFFDGQHYLVESHALSYLPAATFLHHSHQIQPAGTGLLAIGYSYHDHIPNALMEAQSVAALWEPHHLLLEEQATLAQIQSLVSQFRLLHFATHGEFRADNPLFSGVALADGWLTTLDIFNLQLNASLVALSACYTGRHLIGGGDELLGLARAFLSAGTATVLLTHWAVADPTTAGLIRYFYQQLRQGVLKDKALQAAQCWLLNRETNITRPWPYAHPYFWAPFYLMGQANHI